MFQVTQGDHVEGLFRLADNGLVEAAKSASIRAELAQRTVQACIAPETRDLATLPAALNELDVANRAAAAWTFPSRGENAA